MVGRTTRSRSANDTTGEITPCAITVTADRPDQGLWRRRPGASPTGDVGALPPAPTLPGRSPGPAAANVGTCAITRGISDGAAGNYTITFVGAHLTSPRVITVTAATDTKTYDATTARRRSRQSPPAPSPAATPCVHPDFDTATSGRQDPDPGRHGQRRQRRQQLHDHLRQRHHRCDHRAGRSP